MAGNQVLAGFLLIVAAALVVKLRRSAAALALLASYWSLPLYLYLVFPAPFRRIWPGTWKSTTSPVDSFVWDGWWIAGILSTLLAAALSVYFLSRGVLRKATSQTATLGTSK